MVKWSTASIGDGPSLQAVTILTDPSVWPVVKAQNGKSPKAVSFNQQKVTGLRGVTKHTRVQRYTYTARSLSTVLEHHNRTLVFDVLNGHNRHHNSDEISQVKRTVIIEV